MSDGCQDHRNGEAQGPELLAPALLTADDVGRLLSCSRRSVYRLADKGRIPSPVRLGNIVRWRRDELDQWLAEGCPPCRRRR